MDYDDIKLMWCALIFFCLFVLLVLLLPLVLEVIEAHWNEVMKAVSRYYSSSF